MAALRTDIVGTAEDIVTLRWPLHRRIAFAVAMCAAFGEARAAPDVVLPRDVFLDENLMPVLAGRRPKRHAIDAGLMEARFRFGAPELLAEGRAGARSAVYTLGRFVAFLALQVTPKRDAAARLEGVSPPLARIVARATALDPRDRYPSVEELGAALEQFVAEASPHEARVALEPPLPPVAKPAAPDGFTLVELMITVSIVGALAILATTGVHKYVTDAKTTEARRSIGQMAKSAAMADERDAPSTKPSGPGPRPAAEPRRSAQPPAFMH